jgi:anti-sigma factor RsiW
MPPDDALRRVPPGPIECLAAVERLWDFLDGELDAARWAEVDAHLAACAACAGHFAFAKTLLAQLALARADPGDVRALERRVRVGLHAAGYAGRAS